MEENTQHPENQLRQGSGGGGLGTYLGYMLRLFLSPRNGWADLDNDLAARKVRVGRLYFSGFLPFAALCCLTAFVRLVYSGSGGFLTCLQNAITWFTALFVGFQLGVFLISLFIRRLMPEATGIEHRRLEAVGIFAVGMLAVVVLLTNVIKVNLVIIDVLPAYVVYVLWRSSNFIGVEPRNEGLYTLATSVALLGSVYILAFLFFSFV